MSWCPLHASAASALFTPSNWSDANAGLYWSRFFDQWRAPLNDGWPAPLQPSGGDAETELSGGKRSWLNHFTGPDKSVGNPARLAEYHDRQVRLIDALGGRPLHFRLDSPFVTGIGLPHPVENGLLFHHTLACPYLSGSSVKGLVRAFAAETGEIEPTVLQRLLGDRPDRPSGGVGAVAFGDALPTCPVELYVDILTPHLGEWLITDDPIRHRPGDWVEPNPIPFLAIAPGQTFVFPLLPECCAARSRDERDADIAMIEACLAEALRWAGAGAKTALAYGRFSAVPVPAQSFAQTNK